MHMAGKNAAGAKQPNFTDEQTQQLRLAAKSYMMRNGLKEPALAERLDIAQQSINRFMNGGSFTHAHPVDTHVSALVSPFKHLQTINKCTVDSHGNVANMMGVEAIMTTTYRVWYGNDGYTRDQEFSSRKAAIASIRKHCGWTRAFVSGVFTADEERSAVTVHATAKECADGTDTHAPQISWVSR